MPVGDAVGTLELRDVSFRYPGAEEPVVQGHLVHVAGRPDHRHRRQHRRGKTTLVNLVARLFDVTEGQVLVDGVDVRDIRRRPVAAHRPGPPEALPVLGHGRLQPALRQA